MYVECKTEKWWNGPKYIPLFLSSPCIKHLMQFCVPASITSLSKTFWNLLFFIGLPCGFFQNALIGNIRFLDFKEVPWQLYSFYADEMPLHIFYTCNITKRLWKKLQYFVSQYLFIPEIALQSAHLGFVNIGNQQYNCLCINQPITTNFQLLIFHLHHLYMSREHGAVCFTSLKLYLIKIKK